MNEQIFYNAVFDFLIGDLKSEEELTIVLNFLEHVKSVIWCLYWIRQFKKNREDDRRYLGFDSVD
jgi:hypothetical protein